MKNFLKKLVNSEWYPIGVSILVFVGTLINSGLGIAILMFHFILYTTALMNDWFPKKLE